jgi:hypothetical protein
MSAAGRELGLLRSIAADLEAYLKSDIVFWSLSDAGSFHNHYPQLTLGSLLLALAKLRALGGSLPPEAQTEMAELDRALEATRARWRANWLRKAEKEVETRVNAWARAVREQSPADYPAAVRSRLMLDLLLQDVGDEATPAEAQQRARLATLDSLLRHKFKPGGFDLDDDLQAAFPQEPYWYLYGKPEGT